MDLIVILVCHCSDVFSSLCLEAFLACPRDIFCFSRVMAVNKPNRERKIRSASRGRFFGQCNGRFGVWTTASITFAKQYPQRQGMRKEIFYIQKKTGRDGVGRCCIWVWTIVDIREKRNLFESVGTKNVYQARCSSPNAYSNVLY